MRLRLTLLYAGLFLLAGTALITLLYVLVEYSPFGRPPAAPAPPGGAGPVPPEVVADAPRDAELRRLLVNSLVALPVMAFASTALGWYVAGRVLRPLARMTATVRHITADRLDRRLAATGPDDELKELADTFDALLDRLESAFTAQRAFVANASHELRTPLTLQRAMAEVALADPDADAAALRAVLDRLLAAGRHQERLIEALLTLARSRQGPQRRGPFDLAEVTRQTLDERDVVPGARAGTEPRSPLAAGPRVEADLRPAPAAGDRALVERLVANLLGNAARHNVPGGWIRVSTGVEAGRAVLRVSNSGPVIPPGRVDTLLQPFQRLETGRRAMGDGLGLGLSIVAAIAEAHHGTLELSALPGGGLEATVTLPR
ncbi:sensor histidine kinase [Nonomuraea rhodomycinica]|uniref:histidine kinase n=1 Tax=Nonomuraea rhodomycinica TaxID=1712872 RepID=A0A7Y6IRS7_9ACTN|nr:ATP-binding protein [Nonomuraea rhodomycinica]NUW43214.1 HAMP domain-containing protein [Nonomuraea rhodomycinica]